MMNSRVAWILSGWIGRGVLERNGVCIAGLDLVAPTGTRSEDATPCNRRRAVRGLSLMLRVMHEPEAPSALDEEGFGVVRELCRVLTSARPYPAPPGVGAGQAGLLPGANGHRNEPHYRV